MVAAENSNQPARNGDVGDAGAIETIGERQLREAYEDFRRALEALPNAEQFQMLVKRYGQGFGYRRIGQWIAGRAPKSKRTTEDAEQEEHA
jgi:DNA-directed RNA polymerase specialized sigma24 family protein